MIDPPDTKFYLYVPHADLWRGISRAYEAYLKENPRNPKEGFKTVLRDLLTTLDDKELTNDPN